MTNPPQVRVRFAPSPTGHLHVGGARTALFNWLFARKHTGTFVLRIEDTDRERSSPEMTEAILSGLSWLGLDWDEGPLHQADGVERHRAAAERLLAEGKAYRCYYTPGELAAQRAEIGEGYQYRRLSGQESRLRAGRGDLYTVRFQVPRGETVWDDLVHGETRFRSEDVEDFIILRSDGTPVYNLAAVSDDAEAGISDVIRGDDHLSNTPRQIMLYQALGLPVPRFAHVPMILGPDGRRLSKRHGAASVEEYRERGILPDALANFLALLGWSPGEDREVMERAEMVSLFSLQRVNKKSSVFDPEKLLWMNSQYIVRTPAEELVPLMTSALEEAGVISGTEAQERRDDLARLVEALKPRSHTVREMVDQARVYFGPEVEYDQQAVAKHWRHAGEVAARLEAVRDALERLDAWTPESIEEALRSAAGQLGVGFGKVAQPLRIALTGSAASPGIDVVVSVLGPENALGRLELALEWLRQDSGGNS
ncbi:MAG: glutamate--tRNA ligase [Longimicrobiaceae bacterium]